MLTRTLRSLSPASKRCSYLISISERKASLTNAINRGLRRAQNQTDNLGVSIRVSSNARDGRREELSGRLSRVQIDREQRINGSNRQLYRRTQRRQSEREEVSREAPLGKPYTTAGSEFIYGTFAVKAALEAGRRQLHKLYIWRGPGDAENEYDQSILQLARKQKLPVQMVAGSWDKTLLKMSSQRPHNGVVLEASPIPKLPIIAMNPLHTITSELEVQVAAQSLEDKKINDIFKASGSTSAIPRSGDTDRYPLLVWLDQVTDTGNLGAIMRTAHFMGVDAIIVPEHGTAPFSPVTVKASAGAAELVPVLVVKHELEFVRKTQENGWKFIAAVAPDSTSTWKKLSQQGSFNTDSALDKQPCILMVGNEGEGLRPAMQKVADNFVSIRGVKGPADGVESLNVSVAAALLIARLLSRQSQRSKSASMPAKPENHQEDESSALF